HLAQVSDDGKWLVVTSSAGTDDRYEITVLDLTRPDATPRTLIPGLINNWSFIGNKGTVFYFVTNVDAPKLKVATVDLARPDAGPVQLIAEDLATLDGASIVGDSLILSYL